ncbi:MAG TPA: TIGR00730 family Rossman fold protein [Terriglobales bacterium]|nr:TIGR00730 family Rossman fold protein [Terriglobales bacterium]
MASSRELRRVCAYCASSAAADAAYYRAAERLGEELASAGVTIVYGGGAKGSMGALASGALARGGRVIGILPRFMQDLEWGHRGLTQLMLVENMRERKHLMLTDSDAVIALPGGCGTLEELLEAITLKRLGIYLKPIVMLNTRGFFDPLLELLRHCVRERFMNPEHEQMWTAVDEPEQVIAAIRNAPAWSEEARNFAQVEPTSPAKDSV